MSDDDDAMIRSMADAIYGAVLDDIEDDLEWTAERDDYLYASCLAEAHRMHIDPDYEWNGLHCPGFWKPFRVFK